MGPVIDLLATIVTLVGLLAALGYGGYLFMISSVAAKRPGAARLARDARRRVPAAAGLAALALVAVLLTGGGLALQVIGLLVGSGAGLMSVHRLQRERRRLADPAVQ